MHTKQVVHSPESPGDDTIVCLIVVVIESSIVTEETLSGQLIQSFDSLGGNLIKTFGC